MILRPLFRQPVQSSLQRSIRCVSTLPSNPHIYVHPGPGNSHTLSLLPKSPPTAALAIGTTTTVPPTPTSLTENHHFLKILHSVLRAHAHEDPVVRGQAAAFASSSGSSLGSGGSLFPQQQHSRRADGKRRSVGDGAGGASAQGGAGGGGRGGWVHVSDARAPPDFGRIAWPEDIFGSLEVDGEGRFVKGDEGEGVGRYVESGTYRIVTREGILGLTDFLRMKLVERLQEEEEKSLA